jgi:hypothetical protein
MRTCSLLLLVSLAVSLAVGVSADSILEVSRTTDPLSLPLVPFGVTQPVSMTSLLGNQVDTLNSDTLFQNPLASVSLYFPLERRLAIAPENLESLSIYEPSPGAGLSAPLPVVNGTSPANLDLGSLLNNNLPVEYPAIVTVSINPVSFSSPDPVDIGPQPMRAMTPEPSEISLLVVGLAAMALIFRFSPRRV